MFTGLIRETGTIKKIINSGKDMEIKVDCTRVLESMNIGDSISVNGVCLTVVSFDRHGFESNISYKTIENTSFKYLRGGEIVNLESSLTPGDKLGGHFVSGHIDCTARINEFIRIGSSFKIAFELPQKIIPYVSALGSIAIDGISLTVSEVGENNFNIAVIPHTFENTNLKHKKAGDLANIEVDMLSRYVVNYLQTVYERKNEINNKDKILREKLEKYGFTK